jgi:hypothetical protein
MARLQCWRFWLGFLDGRMLLPLSLRASKLGVLL